MFQYSNDNSSGSTICNHRPSPRANMNTPISLRGGNQRLTSSSPNLNRACQSPRSSRQFQPIPAGQPSGQTTPATPVETSNQLIYDNRTVLTNLDCRNHSTIVQPPLCNNMNSQPITSMSSTQMSGMSGNMMMTSQQPHQHYNNQTHSNQNNSNHQQNGNYWSQQQHQQHHRHSLPTHMSYHQPQPMYTNQMCNQQQSHHMSSMGQQTSSMGQSSNMSQQSSNMSQHTSSMGQQSSNMSQQSSSMSHGPHMMNGNPHSPAQHMISPLSPQQMQQAGMMQSPYCPPQPLTSPNLATPAPAPVLSQQQAARHCNCSNAQCGQRCGSAYDRMSMRRCSAPASLSTNQNKDIQSNEVSQSNMRQSTYQRTLEYVEQCQNWVSSSTQPGPGPQAATGNMVINDMNTSLSSLLEENRFFQMSQMIQ